MRKLLLSLVLSSAALTAAAHADTFTFAATTQSGSTGTGTITTNPTGYITGAAVNFSGGNAPIGTFSVTSSYYLNGYTYANLYSASGFANFDLYVKNTLIGAQTDQVCVDKLCSYTQMNFGFGFGSGGITYTTAYAQSVVKGDFLTSGTLTLQAPIVIDVPTAATPEPSSLILLGTGALGMAGAARRRFLARA